MGGEPIRFIMNPAVTVETILSGARHKPRPGLLYEVAPGRVFALTLPTESRVRAFDVLGIAATRNRMLSESIIRRMVGAERAAREAWAAGKDDEAEKAEAALSALQERLASHDPANPNSSSYYVHLIRHRAEIVLSNADGAPYVFDKSDSLTVLTQAVEDWSYMAFFYQDMRKES